MKRLALVFALLSALAPGRAVAVDGRTIFVGPEIAFVDNVGGDFPRYDVAALCATAWPGLGQATEAARNVCIVRQRRLAALSSRNWKDVPIAARANCIRRSDLAGVGAYNVLYMCVNAAIFTAGSKETVNRVESMIRAQNGLPRVDAQAVGSIR